MMLSREEGRKHEIEPVNVILQRLISKIRQDYESRQEGPSEILEQWEDLVGSQVALHAKPRKITKGVLTIFVDSPVWLHELTTFAKPTLLKTLTSKWPWIKDIKFRSGSV